MARLVPDSPVDSLAQSPDSGSVSVSPSSTTLVVRNKGMEVDRSASKRKRAANASVCSPSVRRRRTAEIDGDGNSGSGSESDPADRYDPDQPLPERRKIQRGFRDLMRQVHDNVDEYMQPQSRGISDTLLKADELADSIRQTSDATLDSRLLVSTADLSYRKSVRMTQAGTAEDLDVDEFVSKCISYMRRGAGIATDDGPELSSTQRLRRVSRRHDTDDPDDVGDEGDMFHWEHLGKYACLPFIRRPALQGFLLGPLSAEKKARKATKRTAPLRPETLTQIRPEVLNVEDLAVSENDLTSLCVKILQRLREVQRDVQQTVADLITDDMDEREQVALMHRHGLRSTGGVDLLRFVVNPMSFGQTVENIFYVSFLIRDGRVDVQMDEHDLPSISAIEKEVDTTVPSRNSSSKHQAILSIDMKTWRDVIQVFDIKEPMIKHRQESHQAGPGAMGWYS